MSSSDLLLVRCEDRDQAMMVSTVRRSTATKLHVMTATVEVDMEELRGTEGPGDTNEKQIWPELYLPRFSKST